MHYGKSPFAYESYTSVYGGRLNIEATNRFILSCLSPSHLMLVLLVAVVT